MQEGLTDQLVRCAGRAPRVVVGEGVGMVGGGLVVVGGLLTMIGVHFAVVGGAHVGHLLGEGRRRSVEGHYLGRSAESKAVLVSMQASEHVAADSFFVAMAVVMMVVVMVVVVGGDGDDGGEKRWLDRSCFRAATPNRHVIPPQRCIFKAIQETSGL